LEYASQPGASHLLSQFIIWSCSDFSAALKRYMDLFCFYI
jgi:hypothetical protein